jgi:DNA-binding NtrC family response regulator
VKAGRFREDLFYRLHVFPIAVPPLRERTEDVPELVRHFLVRFAAEEGKRLRAVSAEALRLLRGYAWPGNVRQLENAVFRAVVLAESDEIGADEFPQISAQIESAGTELAAADDAPMLIQASAPMVSPPVLAEGPTLSPGEPEVSTSIPVAPHGALAVLDARGEMRPLDEIEAEIIRFAISHYRGQMSEVARRLRIGRSTLYRKLRDLGLEDNSAANLVETTEKGVSAE